METILIWYCNLTEKTSIISPHFLSGTTFDIGMFKSFNQQSVNALMRDIHIFSAMLVLLLMLFFAVSGFFLAHPNLSGHNAPSTKQEFAGPAWLQQSQQWPEQYAKHGLKLMLWLDDQHDIRGIDFEFEWDEFENLLIISLQGPGGNTIVEYFIADNQIAVEHSEFSFLDMLNNVHRAKHTSTLWQYLSDASAIVMVLFCLTGLWLALIHKNTRRTSSQWFAAGSAVFVITLYLMH